MARRILVAGAGHGGLTAAAQLAKAGFDVTVVERHGKDALGYDWFDALNPAVFAAVGCPHPQDAGIPWKWRADVTYFGPRTAKEKRSGSGSASRRISRSSWSAAISTGF